ncbi:hypothetical protein NLJ89_g11478 [Agrocybe chaxingu]|uniref:Uncharacterized protein n=1 Tax=Agrocybe chaxingu TaxID=84603 RepID=A0A9W8JNN1_9AGAR|nr:hypothetical protein NLJ89_g11478 [Agrocybe chaxingu]
MDSRPKAPKRPPTKIGFHYRGTGPCINGGETTSWTPPEGGRCRWNPSFGQLPQRQQQQHAATPTPPAVPVSSQDAASAPSSQTRANDADSEHLSSESIIPLEDPQREVELDEDGDDGDGEGLGNEGDSDDEDDDDDPDRPNGSSERLSAKRRARHELPPWLRSAFEAALAQCEDRDDNGVRVKLCFGSVYYHFQSVRNSSTARRKS